MCLNKLPVFLLALSPAACGEDAGWSTGVRANAMSVCVAEVGDGLELVGYLDVDCVSGSCHRVVDVECEVTRAGSEVLVESASGTVQVPTGPATCTTDCATPVLKCGLPVLEPGTYTLRYKAQEMEFQAPLSGEACP